MSKENQTGTTLRRVPEADVGCEESWRQSGEDKGRGKARFCAPANHHSDEDTAWEASTSKRQPASTRIRNRAVWMEEVGTQGVSDLALEIMELCVMELVHHRTSPMINCTIKYTRTHTAAHSPSTRTEAGSRTRGYPRLTWTSSVGWITQKTQGPRAERAPTFPRLQCTLLSSFEGEHK
eukprot:3703253-Rhodomonas_salina.3